MLDYQLSKARRKFGDQVVTFNLCCCHGQLAQFPVATCRPFYELAAKRAKLQTTILLPEETKKAACGNNQNFVTRASLRLILLLFVVLANAGLNHRIICMNWIVFECSLIREPLVKNPIKLATHCCCCCSPITYVNARVLRISFHSVFQFPHWIQLIIF